MTSMTGTRRIVISAVVLAVAAVVVVLVLISRPSSSAMAGMDHGAEAVPASTHSTAGSSTSDDMAGMDHAAPATANVEPAKGNEDPATDHHAPGTGHDSGDVPKMDKPVSTPTPSMAEDMPGMDHGTGHTPESTPAPSMSEDMPGMDHGSGGAAEPGHGTGDPAGSGHGTADTAAADPDRPLAPVLGVFGGGTSAVLLTAGLLRRKDRAANEVKLAARAARRSQT